MRYWEELDGGEQAACVQRIQADLEAIEAMSFPVDGEWDGHAVKVLGPPHLHHPYRREYELGRRKRSLRDNEWILVEGVPSDPHPVLTGGQIMTLANSVVVNGVALVTPRPPWRHRPLSPFEKNLRARVRASRPRRT